MSSLYVTVEPRTLREAEERAAADACSCVVSITRESVDERRRREFWEAVEAKRRHHQARHPKWQPLTLVRNG